MKAIIRCVVALYMLHGPAFAQRTDNKQIDVRISVVSAISIQKTQDLNFGKIVRGASNAVLDPRTGLLSGGSGNYGVGVLTVSGAPGEAVTVSAPARVRLNASLRRSGTSTIILAPSFAHAASTSGTWTSGMSFTLGGSRGTPTPSTHYVRVGGTLNLAGARTGAHSGTLTVSVAYGSI